VDVLRQVVLPKLDRVRPAGGQYLASCPVPGHGKGNGDRNPSLTVDRGEQVAVIFSCKAGCDQRDIRAALEARGVDWSLVSRPRDGERRPGGDDTWLPCHKDHGPTGHGKVAEYRYVDAEGRFVFGVTRCAKKDFAQWRPDPSSRPGRRWSITEKDADGTSRRVVPYLLYRLPEVLNAISKGWTVWLAGGEKDVDSLVRAGVVATCNNGGEGSWRAEFAQWLAGADVVIVADRDAAGWKFAANAVETLLPLARSLEVVRALAGKDAFDHFAAGHELHEFVQLGVPLPAPTAVPGCPDCEAEGVQ
jgi:hypothetical protein